MERRCLICDSEKLKALDEIILCSDCYFYQKVVMPNTADIAKHYDSYTKEKHRSILSSHRGIYGYIKSKIISIFKSNFERYNVLEIGFGHGGLLVELKNLGFNVYGVDISESAYRYALINGLDSKNLYLGDFLKLDLKEDFFDIVIMNGVLEEFYNPCDVMEKISKITKKGSVLVIRTKNSLFHIFASSYFSSFIPSAGVLIACGFSFKALNILLNRYGFQPLSYSFTLTKGDPYSQFSLKILAHLIKGFLSLLSYLLYYLSFKKLVISPSFIVISKRL